MTSAHIFYIPAIFFLGFLGGAAMANIFSPKESAKSDIPLIPKIKGWVLALAFGVFAVVFVITHMVPFAGGAKSLHAMLGHQSLLDQRASATAEEVYLRLENFGEAGRAAYQHFTYSGDVIFPLSLLVLLTLLAFFVRERTSLKQSLRLVLIAVPAIWFLTDMAENSVIFYLLAQYPEQNLSVAGTLGIITNLKFGLLLGAVGLPAVFYVLLRKKAAV